MQTLMETGTPFHFGCGHTEPAAWYPELVAAWPYEAPAGDVRVLPDPVICAWCCGEDDSRLDLQPWLLRSTPLAALCLLGRRHRPATSTIDSPPLLARYAYQRRMERRAAGTVPASVRHTALVG